MKKLFPNLRPIGIDLKLAGSTSPLAKAWQVVRVTLLDRAVYWGVAITLVLPAVFATFGRADDFAFHGGGFAALWTSVAFWLWTFISAIVLGTLAQAVVGKQRKQALRYTQWMLFTLSVFAFLLGAGLWFPSVLTVSLLGAIVGTAAVQLIAQWAIGMCTGPECEI